MQNDRTPFYDLPKPHVKNNMADDCNRLRDALDKIDSQLDVMMRKAADLAKIAVNMAGATAQAAGGAGLAPAPPAGAQDKFLRGDGTWQTPPDTNTTYGNMKGATTTANGAAGLAPAPAAGAANRYLRSDGTWQVPPNTTYNVATQTANGLMSGADKKKLDGVQTGATNTPAPAVMKGASTSAAGVAGYAPAPAAGAASRYLRSDGTWQVPPNTTYNVATQTANGLMSGADKKKLDTNVVVKTGGRGDLAGYENAQDLTGSQTITKSSRDCIKIATSGAITLTFSAAGVNEHAAKVICLAASAATTLTIKNAVWANNGSAPAWGNAGKRLVLVADFINGAVILNVVDNTQ